MAIVTISLPLH